MSRSADILFSTADMSAVFSDETHVRRMLAFEVALARSEALAGLVPASAADAIEAAANSLTIDLDQLYLEAGDAASPVVPLVRLLRAEAGGDAARFVHLGATSQDAVDSAMMLQVQEGLGLLIDALDEVGGASAALADEHRGTVMAGRTLLQQAVPITFGLKAARWLGMVTRRSQRLDDLRERSVALQFGGAAGTLSALGDAGPEVARLLASELGLPEPDLPWHAERDRIADIAAALGVVAGTMAKVAMDVVLLAQTEIGEVSEGGGPGKGRSSAMPQKRNPVEATQAIAAARLALGSVKVLLDGIAHAHERATGEWQAEWVALPDVFRYTAGAIEHVRRAVTTLEVHPEQMRANLDVTDGAIMAESLAATLAPHLGREEAQRVVEAASREARGRGLSLRYAAIAEQEIRAVLDDEAIDAALDPAAYLGAADHFIDRALEAFRALPARTSRPS